MGLERTECQEKRGAECSLLSFTCLKKAIQAQHTLLLNGRGKNISLILVTRFLCRAAEQTPRSAVTLGHNGALKSKSGGTERKCVPPGQRRH